MKKHKVSDNALQKAIEQYCEIELASLPSMEKLSDEISPETEAKIQQLIDSIPQKSE